MPRVEEPFKTFEGVLDRVGLFGRYQFFTCVVVQYASILWAGEDLSSYSATLIYVML